MERFSVCGGDARGRLSHGQCRRSARRNVSQPIAVIDPIALPGGSTAVTQTSGDNSTKVATTAYVAANAGGAPSGSASGALAGTYPGPSLAVGALPNGMTATTQANGDNSTKVATTAYVVANGGGAPSGSAGGSLTGSYPNPGLAAASVVAGVAGQSLSPAAVGTIKEVDGFSGGGIGVAQTVWSSGTYPLCSAVSHSGADYLSAGVTTGVTPGTNSQVWYPVTNPSAPTALDCAFYVSAASLVSGTGTVANGGVGATVQMGTAGTYCTNIGLTEPTVSSPGQPVVNSCGPGRSQATVKQCTAKTDGLATLYQPPTLTPYAFASFNWQGFSVDANYIAPAAVNVYGAQQFTMKDMILADATDGSDHEVEFGNAADTAHGWTFEPYLDNVDLGTFRGFGTGAIISTTVSGGVPSFTVTAGGSNYDSATTQVILAGTSDFGRPCSSPGTTTATISAGAITGITSSATGCVSPVYTIVYGGADVSYGYKFSNVTDAKQISDLTNGGVGWIAGMYIADTDTALKIYNYHPESVLQGALILGSADFYSSQCDTIFQYCFNIQGGGTVNLHSPFFEWNNPNMTGSRDYLFLNQGGGIPGYSQPQAVNIENETCGNFPQQPGYAHFDSTAGVIDSPSAATAQRFHRMCMWWTPNIATSLVTASRCKMRTPRW